jgi:hypothetical protein
VAAAALGVAGTGAAPADLDLANPALPLPPQLPWAAGYNPWTGLVQAWPLSFRAPGASVLGSRPPINNQQAMTAQYQMSFTSPPAPSPSAWDTSALMVALQTSGTGGAPPSSTEWFLDTGASSHMSHVPGNFTHPLPSLMPSYITVGNGARLPISHTAATTIPTSSSPLLLSNVLIKPGRKTRNSLARSTRSLLARLELDSFYNKPTRFKTSQLDL